MNIQQEIFNRACRAFERSIEECAVRAMGCSLEDGLKSGRLTVESGQPFVDGRQICFLQPPRVEGMRVVWVFHDLTQEIAQ